MLLIRLLDSRMMNLLRDNFPNSCPQTVSTEAKSYCTKMVGEISMQISLMKLDWLKASFQVHEDRILLSLQNIQETGKLSTLSRVNRGDPLCRQWMNWEVNFPKQSPSEDCLDFVPSLFLFKSFNSSLKGSRSIPFKLNCEMGIHKSN